MTSAAPIREATAFFTEDQLESFHRDGFVIVRGLLAPEEARLIAGWVDELAAFAEVPGKSMFYYEASVLDADERVLSRIEYFADFHERLGRLMSGPELLGRSAELFGADAVLFKEKVNFKLPGGQGFEPHQDAQAGWRDYGDLHITIMITVDPASEENGCLEIAAGHHRRGLIGELWKPMTERQLDGIDFVKLPTEPGDAVFFDSFTPHRSAPNRSDRRRRVLYITYAKAADGDNRERYFADKRRNYPPDIERQPGKSYEYKV
ncbi:MAG: phytanoyl-CoA dioxygenase family protein [Proteobacteria bacterium]|nr:phytanoyl-CoA dioxygenase family protein [Pseudomonadota bacterium]